MKQKNIAGLWFALFVGIWLIKTWHWPFLGDAALIRYVVLQLERHCAPYRQIHDINMPGAYILDWVVLRFLGPGSAPHRLYDCLLLALIAAAMVYIAGPHNRAIGVCGGCLFALFHARDGFQEIGQRDLALAALLLIAAALAIHIHQSGNLKLLTFFGFIVGAACTIKPTALVFFLIAIPLIAPATRKQRWAILRWIFIGFTLSLVPVVVFLQYYKALPSFIDTLRTYLPFHTQLGAHSLGTLLHLLFSPSLAVWTALVLVGLWTLKPIGFKEQAAILCVVAGLLSYLLQMRGYNYHRYPFVAAVLLSLVLVVSGMLESRSWMRVCATLIALYCAALCPLFTRTALNSPRTTPQGLDQLQNDLEQIHGDASYQCIDSISGCIDTLVHLDRPQATGEMYDEFLFHQPMPGLLERNRSDFLMQLKRTPPSVIIVTMGLFPETPQGYEKLLRWPAFNIWLSNCYSIANDRFFPAINGYPAIGYRLYRPSRVPCAVGP